LQKFSVTGFLPSPLMHPQWSSVTHPQRNLQHFSAPRFSTLLLLTPLAVDENKSRRAPAHRCATRATECESAQPRRFSAWWTDPVKLIPQCPGLCHLARSVSQFCCVHYCQDRRVCYAMQCQTTNQTVLLIKIYLPTSTPRGR
jgi:hypothetical protein